MTSDIPGKIVEGLRRFFAAPFSRSVTVVLLSLLALFILMDFVVMPIYTRHGTARLVPNLTLMPAQSAQQAADSAGFVLVISHGKVSSRVREGWILEQHPTAGSRAKPGRKIRVVPALLAAPDVAPDLLHLDLRDAQLRCKNIGLVSGPTDVQYRFSNRVPKGSVMEQDPKSGEPVKPGTVVKLILSMGPEPAHFYVPLLLDQSLHDARSALREAGLTLGNIERRETDEYPAGTVINQSIPAGDAVEPGAQVDVAVAVPTRPESDGISEKAPVPTPEIERNTGRDDLRIQDSLRREQERQQRDSVRRSRRRS